MDDDTWKFSECLGKDVHDYVVKTHPTKPKCIVESIHDKQERYALKSWILHWLQDAFLPQGYPESVSSDYLHYQMWDTLQAYCSSVAGAVSLHATLGSLGVGQEGSTALAATLTWLTNTGAGMVAAIGFTYCKGTHLDSNNKQWRLFADVSNDVAHLIKLATPLLPVPPLLPLTGAAVLYALVGVSGGATRTALTAHQARCNNLADVAAKDGSQETLVNLAALLTSMVMLPLITHSLMMTWCVFLVLLFVHLVCNHRAVRAVVAPSLNRPRLLLLLDQFAQARTVPDVAQANANEPLLFGSAFRRDYLCPGWSLELGCSLQRALSLASPLREKPSLRDNFMVLVSWSECRVFVPLTKAASSRDILLACWTAFLIAQRPLQTKDVERIRDKAKASFPLIMAKMEGQGWAVDEIYLGVGEWRLL